MHVYHGPSQQGYKEELSYGNEVLLQDTMHLKQRPCCQWGSLCRDPAGNRTTWRPPDHCKKMQTGVVWTCLLFIRSGQSHLAGHSERGKKTRQTEKRSRKTSSRILTGLEFTNSQRAVENKEKWRKLVVKSSVVPQQPLRLGDKWRWRRTGTRRKWCLKNWEERN